LRNVMIGIGNSGQARLRPAAQRHAESADPVLAEAARWAVGRLPL
jgi:epoxyqueuosine reductase